MTKKTVNPEAPKGKVIWSGVAASDDRDTTFDGLPEPDPTPAPLPRSTRLASLLADLALDGAGS